MSWPNECKILVPIDFSDDSFAALEVALEWAGDPDRVTLIHVLADLPVTDPGVVWQTIKDETRAEHAKDALRRRLIEMGRNGLAMEIAVGDAGHRISEFAKQIDAGLVVMPSHGRSGVKRLLIGSVAERVMRLAHCPVLVLRE